MKKLALILVFALIALPAVVFAGPRDQLRGWKTEQRLQKLGSETDSSKAPDPLFDDLLETLAAEMLRPKVGACEFSSGKAGLSCKAPIGFSAGSQLATMLYRLRTTLYTGGAATEAVCLEGPWGRAQPLLLDKAGAAGFLTLAGIDEADIEAQQFSVGKIGSSLVALSPELLGNGLYEEIRRQADAGKTSVTFRMTPFPQKTPVELTLKTTKGEELTFAVELNGARQDVKVSKKARWALSGTNKKFKYRGDKITHQVLLGALLRAGKVSITNIVSEDFFPRVYPKLSGESTHEVHLLGANSSWFGKSKFSVKPRARMGRTGGTCDIHIEFSSKGDSSVMTGPLRVGDWEKVSLTRVIDLSLETSQTAYLLPAPVRDGEEQLTAEEFDELLERPAVCEKRCGKAAAHSGPAVITDRRGEIVKTFPALDFDADACVQTCLVKSEYASCIDERVFEAEGAGKKRYGLGYCDARK